MLIQVKGGFLHINIVNPKKIGYTIYVETLVLESYSQTYVTTLTIKAMTHESRQEKII